MNHHKLYSKDNKGDLRYWEISNDGSLIEIKYGKVGGAELIETEIVNYGLAGRTQDQQVESRIKSRVGKKIDSGYVYDMNNARDNARTNVLGLDRPMLATRHDRIKDMKFEANYVQYKYDGHRCLIKNDGGDIIAYSRNGKVIDSISHILNELDGVLPDGTTLDGELYAHDTPLQTITSWVKKKQLRTSSLSFICYDVLMDECYSIRHSFISNMRKMNKIEIAQTSLLMGEFDLIPLLDSAKEKGYEGLIVRPIGSPYECGKRSKSLIKVKSWMDDEYKVIKISKGVDGQAILHLQHNGRAFRVTSPGTFDQKFYVAENKDLYVGKKVNVQYANLTKDGVPFHPVATMWRDKDNE